MKTIMLYGQLGKKYGKVHRYDVKNPAEAIRALCATQEGFKDSLISGGEFKILIGGKQDLDEQELLHPVSDKESIRIIPVVSGSNQAVGKVILGAALVYFAPPALLLAGPAFGLSATAATLIATGIQSVGYGLILGGISQLLFAPPKIDNNDPANNKASFMFNGAVNTIAQGNPVPVLYGELIVGSQVVSAGLTTEEIPL